MAGFWDFLTGKKEDDTTAGAAPESSTPADEPRALLAEKAGAEGEAASGKDAGYTVDDAIALMRTLPFTEDKTTDELVLRVLRKTLQSTRVSVPDIIDAASGREAALDGSIKGDRDAIAQLERDIAARHASIALLEAELDETRKVRKRLEVALASQTQARPAFVVPETPTKSADGAPKRANADAPPKAAAPSSTPPEPGPDRAPPTEPPPTVRPNSDDDLPTSAIVSGDQVESIKPPPLPIAGRNG